MGKNSGLSFDEINELRICDLAAYADIVSGEDGGEVSREVTQEDIDKFFH